MHATMHCMRICTYDDCERKHYAKDLCQCHYLQLRAGALHAIVPRGSYNRAPNGNTPNKDGYTRADMDGRTYYAHRLVMMGRLGRELLPSETVHHKNGDRSDNSPSNLELWYKGQPAGQRIPDLIAYIAEYHAESMREALTTTPPCA